MPYKSSQVANFFLDKGDETSNPITMLKLIKICYVAHGWMLALEDQPLIDETVEAWQYGPVIPSLYHEFKRFQKSPITSRAKDFRFDDLEPVIPQLPPKDTETKAILEKVWDVYKATSGNSLISLTHADGTPWKECYKSGALSTPIPNDLIKEYYKKVFEKLFANEQ